MRDRKTDRVIYLDTDNRARAVDPRAPLEIPRISSLPPGMSERERNGHVLGAVIGLACGAGMVEELPLAMQALALASGAGLCWISWRLAVRRARKRSAR